MALHTFNDPLLIVDNTPPDGGFGGRGGRLGLLECKESGVIGSDKIRFRSCIYNSINWSTLLSISST